MIFYSDFSLPQQCIATIIMLPLLLQQMELVTGWQLLTGNGGVMSVMDTSSV